MKDQVLNTVLFERFRVPVSVAKSNAKKRGIPWGVSIRDLNDAVLACGWKCAVTRVKFEYGPPVDGARRPWSPSLDRIESSRGYVPGNVRFVCVAANLAMNTWGEKVLHRMAESLIASRRVNPPALPVVPPAP